VKSLITSRTTVILLVGLLIISVIVLSIGQNESTTIPSSTNRGPSGLQVAAELLRGEGFQVSVSRVRQPKEDPNTLLVLPLVHKSSGFAVSDEAENDQEIYDDFLKAGGTILVLNFKRDFAATSKSRKSQPTVELSDLIFKQRFRTTILEAYDFQPITKTVDYDSDYPVVCDSTEYKGLKSYFVIRSKGQAPGKVFEFTDASVFTNRFLTDLDHAPLFVSILRSAAKSKKIVFHEATILGAQKQGILATLGPWAEAGWNQFLVLLLVVLWSLNTRFGLPEVSRASQRSSRELVDALGVLLLRGKQTLIAAEFLRSRAESELRKVARAPRDADVPSLLKSAPEDLASAYLKLAEISESEKIIPKELLTTYANWEKALDAWKQDRRTRPITG
jgi:hypothetical protein